MDPIETLIKEATVLSKKWSPFSNDNKEKSIELFKKAAMQSKISKKWDDAGKLYEQAAEIATKIKEQDICFECYRLAANAWRNISNNESIRCYKMCLILTSNTTYCASITKDIAEIEEKNYKYTDALKWYEEAEKYYRANDNNSQANNMLLKIADLNAETEYYEKAFLLYEQAATYAADKTLLVYSLSGYLFKAGLCYIASGKTCDEHTNKLDEYKNKYASFDKTKQCVLLENCIKSIFNNDINEFSNFLEDYDRIYRLDKLSTSILLTIKRSFVKPIASEPDLIGDGKEINLQ